MKKTKYQCYTCSFFSDRKSNFSKHMASDNHKHFEQMKIHHEQTIKMLEETITAHEQTIKMLKETIDRNRYKKNDVYDKILSTELISWDTIPADLAGIVLNTKNLIDRYEFYEMIMRRYFYDNQDKPKLICTDISRKKFKYRNSKHNKIQSESCFRSMIKHITSQIKKRSLRIHLYGSLMDKTGDYPDNLPNIVNYRLKTARLDGFAKFVA